MNKTFDLLGLIVEGQAVTTTASTTGVNIDGLAIGGVSYVAVINAGTLVGTFDGANNYTVAVQVSDAIGGTYVTVGNVATISEAGQHQVGFTSEQIESLVSGADFFRLTVAKVGTTATGVTVTSFISKV